MLEATYADQAFSANVKTLSESSVRIATALEAIANHLGTIAGLAKMSSVERQYADREGFTRSNFQQTN